MYFNRNLLRNNKLQNLAYLLLIHRRKKEGKMKAKKFTIIVLLLGLALVWFGCDTPRWRGEECCCCEDDYYCDDYAPPPTPTGVYSVTGDECVRLYWDPVNVCDIAGYRVWRGYSETGYYYLIGETPSAYFVDTDVENGQTYYYAVSAYDIWGNESNLSTDLVFDTPRPEGHGERAYIMEEYPDDAGYDFSEYWVVPYDYPTADIYFGYDSDECEYYMQAANSSTDILIYGHTEDLSDVDWAPENGWLEGARVEIHEEYSYLVWTADNHFAHIRIVRLDGPVIEFDWAYQTDPGNPELVVRPQENPFEKIGAKVRKIRHSVRSVNRNEI